MLVVIPENIRYVLVERILQVDQLLRSAPSVMRRTILKLRPESFERTSAVELGWSDHVIFSI